MITQKCFWDLRSETVLGIPIIVKLSKKGEPKTIYAIPYKQIAQYISNARGDFVGNSLTVKSVGMNRLIQYAKKINCVDWYSIDAVAIFADIVVDDSVDKMLFAWYNPYTNSISCVTDRHKNRISKPKDFTLSVLTMYISKYHADADYFVKLCGAQKGSYRVNKNAIGDGYFLSKRGLSARISHILKNSSSLELTEADIKSIPQNRIMECFLIISMIKILNFYYLSSDNHCACYHSIAFNQEELDRDVPNRTRAKVAENLFYQNSVLAFKALLWTLGCDNHTNIVKSIPRGTFSQLQLNDKTWECYTDSLYRIIAICAGYCSVGTDIASRAKDSLVHFNGGHHVGVAFDLLLGKGGGQMSSMMVNFFLRGDWLLAQNLCYSTTINELVNALLRIFLHNTKYMAFDGDILAIMFDGKENYQYAKT